MDLDSADPDRVSEEIEDGGSWIKEKWDLKIEGPEVRIYGRYSASFKNKGRIDYKKPDDLKDLKVN